MTNLLWRLFGNPSRSAETVAGSQGAPASEGVRPDESVEDLYPEFCRTFCHRPGVNFMDFLAADGATRMIEWLQPSTPCALPRAFIRLAVDATRKGTRFWEMPGLSMYYEGNWTKGGGLPDQNSQDALSVLAQMLAKPITVYYTETQNGPIMKMVFDP